MDGTIIDTEPYWMEAETDLITQYGGTWDHEAALQLVGQGLWHSARVLQSRGVDLSEGEIVEHLTGMVHERIRVGGLPWRPGARELLLELRSAGIPTALVTMSIRTLAQTVAGSIDFEAFEHVVAGDEVEHSKPHPAAYLRALELLGVEARDCVAIEDSPPGVASATAAGIATIGVPLHVPLAGDGTFVIWPTLAGRTLDDLAAVRAREGTGKRMSDAVRRQSGPFRVGDRVQLTGPKGRLNTITLEAGGAFHTHTGILDHDLIIGQPDASIVTSNNGVEYLALRPLLTDFVMSMPRGAAIVYPKDAAQILSVADIFPGATVVEAGVGSGALALSLLRAIGPDGTLHSFERRQEFADIAQANATAFLGAVPSNWSVAVGDLVEALPAAVEDGAVDRVILDMLAPWECIGVAAQALTPGGVLLCYVATVTQLSRTAEAIRGTGQFTAPESSETLIRTWHVEGLAVRPDHRMIGHTGFLIVARRLAPGARLPEVARRASKSDYTDEDVEVWTPGALGDRTASDKSLRKSLREARAAAAAATGDSKSSEAEPLE
jgi:HAD superfamily hydrolase (TIGR01509 family)